MNKIIPVIIALIVGGYAGFHLGAFGLYRSFIDVVGVNVSQDPALVDDAKRLGLNYSDVNLSYSQDLKADDVADNSQTEGVFTPPNTIQVKSGLTKQEELVAVAYEFMHYYWQNSSAEAKQKMGKLYQDYYDNDYGFQQATKLYTGTSEVLADERNSTACTITPPYVLTDEFNKYCDQYIPNRSILFNY